MAKQQSPSVSYRAWRRKWRPTPVFLPGESYGLRSLMGYSPQGCTELNMTEATQHTHGMGNYIQYAVIKQNEKEYKNIYTYIYVMYN